MRAPSSSRMFEETTVAMYSRTSSGMCSASLCAFFRRIAMRVSRSGGLHVGDQTPFEAAPHPILEAGEMLRATSLVMTTCLL